MKKTISSLGFLFMVISFSGAAQAATFSVPSSNEPSGTLAAYANNFDFQSSTAKQLTTNVLDFQASSSETMPDVAVEAVLKIKGVCIASSAFIALLAPQTTEKLLSQFVSQLDLDTNDDQTAIQMINFMANGLSKATQSLGYSVTDPSGEQMLIFIDLDSSATLDRSPAIEVLTIQ